MLAAVQLGIARSRASHGKENAGCHAPELVGRSSCSQDVLRRAAAVASTDASVLPRDPTLPESTPTPEEPERPLEARLEPEPAPDDRVDPGLPSGDGPEPGLPLEAHLNLREHVKELERKLISRAMTAVGGNQSEAARRLGVSRGALLGRLRKYGQATG